MPPVVAPVAYAALALAAGFVWRWMRRDGVPAEREPAGRAPTEIFDTVPLVRGEDGVYRPGPGRS